MGVARFLLFLLAVLVLPITALGGASRAEEVSFRFSRDVMVKPGWAMLELPDDVLDAALSNLADVRLLSDGTEISYVLEERVEAAKPLVDFVKVESRPGIETTALLDRGPNPAACDTLYVVTARSPHGFQKPVVLEGSADGKAFVEIARGIFRSGFEIPSLKQLRFALNNRRFLRLRLDDKLIRFGKHEKREEVVVPVSARCFIGAPPEAPTREIALQFERVATEDAKVDTYLLRPPSANLTIVRLDLEIVDPTFTRKARIYQRASSGVLSRWLLGHTTLVRSAASPEVTAFLIDSYKYQGTALELAVEREGPPLELTKVRASVRSKRLVFLAPKTPVTLHYGSSGASLPAYEFGDAFAHGRPRVLTPATLGPVRDGGEAAGDRASKGRPLLNAADWKYRRPINLPKGGSLAFLDLTQEAETLDQVRIVDAKGRQVPWLREDLELESERALTFTVGRSGTNTVLKLAGFDPAETINRLVLNATAPAFFDRDVHAYVEHAAERGTKERRRVGSETWVRKTIAKEPVSITTRVSGEPELFVEIADADGPPLTISKVVAYVERSRINFVFEPGEPLWLLANNSALTRSLDFATEVSDAWTMGPALPATLGERLESPAPPPSPRLPAPPLRPRGTPSGFWWVVAGAGGLALLVLLALIRRLVRR
jgi:hypothetical protein